MFDWAFCKIRTPNDDSEAETGILVKYNVSNYITECF